MNKMCECFYLEENISFFNFSKGHVTSKKGKKLIQNILGICLSQNDSLVIPIAIHRGEFLPCVSNGLHPLGHIDGDMGRYLTHAT